MDELQAWLGRQFDDRLLEPNSSLGKAIAYMRKHWARLTLFLGQAGAPLDNNICERALKMSIRHRKNPLFYKTDNWMPWNYRQTHDRIAPPAEPAR